MLFLRYEPSIHKMVIGDAIIEEAEDLVSLPMRWQKTNRKATRDEKRFEWDRLVNRVARWNLWEWHDEYVRDYMEFQSTLFLPVKSYNRLVSQ